MKYARQEYERKFLLSARPSRLSLTYRTIDDRYLIGTSLRLRLVSDERGHVLTRKLNQKIRRDDGTTWITSIYLSQQEYRLIESLPAICSTMRRYRLECDTRCFAVDVIDASGEEIVLAEVEADSQAEIDADVSLPEMVREVTSEPAFSGYEIALRMNSRHAQPGATDNPDDAQRLREDH